MSFLLSSESSIIFVGGESSVKCQSRSRTCEAVASALETYWQALQLLDMIFVRQLGYYFGRSTSDPYFKTMEAHSSHVDFCD